MLCRNRGCGSVFSITSAGTERVIYSFRGAKDGEYPNGGLVDVHGTLYGTTVRGGTKDLGTVFSVSTSGLHRVLHSFLGRENDGYYPYAGLTVVNGMLYGVTGMGGAGSRGTVFQIDPKTDVESTLYSFQGGNDGESPSGQLLDVGDTLYGTTQLGGGPSYSGTVFAVTTAGAETVLYRFQGGSDGSFPYAGLIEVNGTFYGTTEFGGGTGCDLSGCGSVFALTSTGSETVLHSFAGGTDGQTPIGGVTPLNHKLYGTTEFGGGTGCNGYGCGTVFALTP
jgi:uncharacterized repeat protein (TIGR03803 family)